MQSMPWRESRAETRKVDAQLRECGVESGGRERGGVGAEEGVWQVWWWEDGEVGEGVWEVSLIS
jgi:hypothetical protein